VQLWVPALKVESMTGTVLTCSWLCRKSELDLAFSSTELNILVPAWAPSVAITGTTANASNQLTAVSRADVLIVGDHILNAAGTIPTGTRVKSISGATVTLTQNASGAATASQIFSSRLHTFTSAVVV
jgi:hypothetical protein